MECPQHARQEKRAINQKMRLKDARHSLLAINSFFIITFLLFGAIVIHITQVREKSGDLCLYFSKGVALNMN